MNSKQQSLDTIDMTSHVKKILLLACGSFNPPTPMHLRIFEIARDYFVENGSHQVIGGIISPANDAYKKPGLISSTHRCAMIKGVLQTSDWIRLSDWECKQEDFTRTRISLQYHQNYANSYINDINGTANEIVPNWLPHNIREMTGNIQVKLLCGADLLETFSVPGLWSQEDIEAILGQHGLVVISRSGSNPEKFIFESDLLTKYKSNITVVTNWVPNEVSSTLARRLISRQFSVKYLLDDFVIDYIKRFELYGSASKTDTMSNVKTLLNRPGQAVQIVTDTSGTHDIEHEDEVGECKISTIKLPATVGNSKCSSFGMNKLACLSDNHLDCIAGSNGDGFNDTENRFETLSEAGMPSTSDRTQNDLIKFVFTSHGIRVISDKEYVV